MKMVGLVGAVAGIVLILLGLVGMVSGQSGAQVGPLVIGAVLVVAGGLVARRARTR